MAEEKALTTLTPEEWRLATPEQLKATAEQVKMLIPGGHKLTDQQAVAAVQHALASGLNPITDVWYWGGSDGQLVIGDRYTMLVTWARSKSNYSTRYRTLTLKEKQEHGLKPADIAVWCWLLRKDEREQVKEFIGMGFEPPQAYEMVATRVIGVVTEGDRRTKAGKPKDPPVGWTWPQRAEIRALKNAIRQAYGKPTREELQALSWQVEGRKTEPGDWVVEGEELTPYDRQLHALHSAKEREAREHIGDRDASDAFKDMFGESPEWGKGVKLTVGEDPAGLKEPQDWDEFGEWVDRIGRDRQIAKDVLLDLFEGVVSPTFNREYFTAMVKYYDEHPLEVPPEAEDEPTTEPT